MDTKEVSKEDLILEELQNVQSTSQIILKEIRTRISIAPAGITYMALENQPGLFMCVKGGNKEAIFAILMHTKFETPPAGLPVQEIGPDYFH